MKLVILLIFKILCHHDIITISYWKSKIWDQGIKNSLYAEFAELITLNIAMVAQKDFRPSA